ncbi:Glucose-repressible alcohol dehydrogenase transcriptional effector CCR4 and related proteins [Plasmopara halstedii]|uniref:Glucose-repressible alcohol dehydrogenase transcriptional effector CCR4 and related proteins n=1 Tax=Plasmopara halstedii TaxID=4781 RepID=A0A0P1B4G9_PLAHL|nr:Glucose-repressible alcohol dehydrogenase transcriptional effector CCR4 and related proteins [Plasmopara halstedii]CEG49670.1 Glucose-repressible alcohol dehydrogenase transcriptional effector CCR4 and related proteins [Plasmopara halstedii]|eukprot:XP_024586039.1 Glucose-repressible alcohol dehydrogenase transcriptional effector CCR4 and related proteins [Plasmopara halstedii]
MAHSLRPFVPVEKDVVNMVELQALDKVSVLTYNILSQMGARRLQRKGRNYVKTAILNIQKRRERLLREILAYDTDLICLQEVDEYDDWWVTELAIAGYDSIYATAAASDSTLVMKKLDEGLVIAFKTSLFQLLKSTEIHLNEICTNIVNENVAARAKQGKLALVVCLQPSETSTLPSALCIATTQLAAGATPELEHVRLLQTEYLCHQLSGFNADFQLPVILTGTFNAIPTSDVYHKIRRSRDRDQNSSIIYYEMMKSAYEEYSINSNEPEFTFSSDKFHGTIDYIFYSAQQFTPYQVLKLLTYEELKEAIEIKDTERIKHKSDDGHQDVTDCALGLLPNTHCPSDHLPLACIFAIQKQNLAVEWN